MSLKQNIVDYTTQRKKIVEEIGELYDLTAKKDEQLTKLDNDFGEKYGLTEEGILTFKNLTKFISKVVEEKEEEKKENKNE